MAVWKYTLVGRPGSKEIKCTVILLVSIQNGEFELKHRDRGKTDEIQ